MVILIPPIILVVCLGVIAYIVIRKFPVLVNLDIKSLPEERIYRKKKEIINKRIEKSGKILREKFAKYSSPLRKLWGLLQLRFRIYMGKIERLIHHEQVMKTKTEKAGLSTEEQEEKLRQMIQDAEQNLKLENFDQAESMFIGAIKFNAKSAPAYRGLADTYLAKNSLEEARQTYKFVLQLEPNDDCVLVKLADIAESQGDIEEAIQYYQQAVLINDSFSPRFYHLAELLIKVGQPQVAREAILQSVELEPQNPKYLDLLTEIAILCGDNDLASKGYNDLRLVNLDNQKLESFKERIDKIQVLKMAVASKK